MISETGGLVFAKKYNLFCIHQIPNTSLKKVKRVSVLHNFFLDAKVSFAFLQNKTQNFHFVCVNDLCMYSLLVMIFFLKVTILSLNMCSTHSKLVFLVSYSVSIMNVLRFFDKFIALDIP